MKANIRTLAIGLLAILLVIFHYRNQPWTPTRIAGAGIGLPALALLILARIQLGASFSVRPEAHALVTHGLYSRIRNPIYLFGGLTIASVLLFIDQPLALGVFAVIIPMQISRARREANVLETKFGDAYRQYRSHTWF
jgi:protein-S-isoprenylcysteine O-methyltransferase Ste14